MKQGDIQKHFNDIAGKYDCFKRKNWLYYWGLKRGVKWMLGTNYERLLDYGCGTGEILNFLAPKHGFGYDISTEMLKIAKRKYDYKFGSRLKYKFDSVIMVDVVEHCVDLKIDLRKIYSVTEMGGILVVSVVERKWEWFVDFWEKWVGKMPEGDHKRLSKEEIVEVAKRTGWKLERIAIGWPVPIITLLRFRK